MKTITLILLLFSVSPSLICQIRFGPKVGAQLSWAAFEDKEYYNTHTSYPLPGIVAGGLLNYRVNKLLSLETEFFYSQNRRYITRQDPFLQKPVSNKSLYHYLNLPILLRLSGHTRFKENRIEYYVNMGPQLMWWLGGKGEIKHPYLEEELSLEVMPYKIVFSDSTLEDYTNSLLVRGANRSQMALDIGGGVVFDLGFGHGIVVDLRGSFGIGKTYMAQQPGYFGPIDYEDNMKAVNHGFALTVGYMRDLDFYALLKKGRKAKTSH